MRIYLLATLGALLGFLKSAFAGEIEAPGHAEAFTRAFEPGWSVEVDDALEGEPPHLIKLNFRVNDLGRVKIVSGQICAADPFVGLDAKPFLQSVPNGTFRVMLALISGALGDGRVAFARVEFSPEPVTLWRMAMTAGDDPSNPGPGENPGYQVDSGIGSFFDPAAGRAAREFLKADSGLADRWLEIGKEGGRGERGGHGFRLITDMGPSNLIAFDAGWGDGVYTSWFGFDAKGDVAVLVTDFQSIDWTKAKL